MGCKTNTQDSTMERRNSKENENTTDRDSTITQSLSNPAPNIDVQSSNRGSVQGDSVYRGSVQGDSVYRGSVQGDSVFVTSVNNSTPNGHNPQSSNRGSLHGEPNSATSVNNSTPNGHNPHLPHSSTDPNFRGHRPHSAHHHRLIGRILRELGDGYCYSCGIALRQMGDELAGEYEVRRALSTGDLPNFVKNS